MSPCTQAPQVNLIVDTAYISPLNVKTTVKIPFHLEPKYAALLGIHFNLYQPSDSKVIVSMSSWIEVSIPWTFHEIKNGIKIDIRSTIDSDLPPCGLCYYGNDYSLRILDTFFPCYKQCWKSRIGTLFSVHWLLITEKEVQSFGDNITLHYCLNPSLYTLASLCFAG